jgi:hypothetical protein
LADASHDHSTSFSSTQITPQISLLQGKDGNVAALTGEQGILIIDDKTVIIPGHGPLGKKADLEAFRLMLLGTAEEVQTMKDKGMNLEAMQAQGLSEKWDDWTDGFLNTPTWISIVASSL